MGPQGDKAAPKAPNFTPNDAQSLPKPARKHPKTPKIIQSDPKMPPKGLQNSYKPSKKRNGHLERILKRYVG